ncbi:hypothetical protein GOODEAATRI_025342, partial [Goodea atripinnis]
DLVCLFDVYLTPLQSETFLSKDEMLLFSLGGSFLYYADHFKLYSGFCANHIKVQKVLEREALRAMEKVASHINEMQKIYEDYGCVFDQLAAEQNGADKQVTEISMGEFLVHSSVVWLNPLPCLRRLRKEPQLTLFGGFRLTLSSTSSRSADLDPFRFRWLIPVSALQIRPGNIPEDPCVWELVHSRSEVEGRPEMVFQLCSSDLETKSALLRALTSLLKDRAPGCSLRRTKQSTAERSSTWRRRHRQGRTDLQGITPHPPEESYRPNGLLDETCSEPLLPSHSGSSGMRPRLCSLTGDLEAQLQRLNFSEEAQGAMHHVDEEKRCSSSLRRGPEGDGQDFSNFVGRDFSVQSMASIINEDCFYDSVLGIQTDSFTLLT